jgi:hypothetical protein
VDKKWTNKSRRVCRPFSLVMGSGPRSRKRLRQSAAVRNRSSGLRRVIFMHRGGPKGHECFLFKIDDIVQLTKLTQPTQLTQLL